MSYTKKTWKNYPDTTTPITADNLNHMENGIADAHTDIAAINTSLSQFSDNGKVTNFSVGEDGSPYITYKVGADSVTKKLGSTSPLSEFEGLEYIQTNLAPYLDRAQIMGGGYCIKDGYVYVKVTIKSLTLNFAGNVALVGFPKTNETSKEYFNLCEKEDNIIYFLDTGKISYNALDSKTSRILSLNGLNIGEIATYYCKYPYV